jgi:plasmid stabilization system protein ParE
VKFSFHPEADEELDSAVSYYENCESGLGLDFLRMIDACIRNAIDYPLMWPEIAPGVRRSLVHRFPFGILYCVESDGIFILAVMHLHRDPEYWKHRQQETKP